MSIFNAAGQNYYVPGTDFLAEHAKCSIPARSGLGLAHRDPRKRARYLDGVYEDITRLLGAIDRNVQNNSFEVDLGSDGLMKYTRIARVHFSLWGQMASLSVFWINGYGGGLFLPFTDGTNGRSTFGGGRYLYDTIKGADLGVGSTDMVLDFNYAYNPSCAYDEQWVCPLPPPENRLAFDVFAGEQNPW